MWEIAQDKPSWWRFWLQYHICSKVTLLSTCTQSVFSAVHYKNLFQSLSDNQYKNTLLNISNAVIKTFLYPALSKGIIFLLGRHLGSLTVFIQYVYH